MKRHSIGAVVLISWGLSWWTGSSGGFYGGYKTEAACKAAALEMNSEQKTAAIKYAAEVAAEKRANPNVLYGSAVDLGPVDWKCIENKTQTQATSH